MWRTIVLGKLIISIVASIIIGLICFNTAWRAEETLASSTQWGLLGIFFFGLAISFSVVIVLLFRKKK